MDRILADQIRILIRYAKIDTVTDKLNGYTYIIFYLIYNNIKCDTYYDIIVYISMFPPYPLSLTSIAMDYVKPRPQNIYHSRDAIRISDAYT